MLLRFFSKSPSVGVWHVSCSGGWAPFVVTSASIWPRTTFARSFVLVFLANFFIIDAGTRESLPAREGILEDFWLEALIGHWERDLVSSILALAVSASDSVGYMFEAGNKDIVGHLGTNPNEDLWLEIEHIDAVWVQWLLPEAVYLLQRHVLRVRPVVCNLEDIYSVFVFFASTIFAIISYFAIKVGTVIVLDKLFTVINDPKLWLLRQTQIFR